ncbi:hypothetical protein QFZ99_001526 [Paraburkholderia atlantica]
MTLKKTRLWVLLAAFAAAPAFAQNIAVVNGTPIPKSRADALIQQLVHQGQQDTPQLQQAVREELVNREILMQEALRRGLPNRPDIKAQIAVAQQTVVLRALIEDFVKNNQPTDAEVHRALQRARQGCGRQGISPAPYPRRQRAAGEGPDREDQGRRKLRRSRQAVLEGPGIGQERRRPRLVGPEGLRA